MMVRSNTKRLMATAVFCEIEGSTALLVNEPDAGAELVATFMRDAVALADSHDARDVRSLGDRLLAVFGSPSDAMRFVEQLRGRMAAMHRRGRELVLGLRIGVATGEMLIEPDPLGVPVNLAASLAKSAAANEIIVDEATAMLTSKWKRVWRATNVRPNLRGLPRSVPVYASSVNGSTP